MTSHARELKLTDALGRTLSAARAANKIEEVFHPRLEAVEAVEEAFGCRVPDPVLAYFAAGLAGRYSRPMTSPRAMLELTRYLQEELEEQRERGYPIRWSPDTVVVFDEDNANFLAFDRRTAPDSDAILFIDHEGVWTDPPTKMTLRSYLKSEADRFEGDIDKLEPFAAEVRDVPAAESGESDDVFVRHAKFGRGRIIEKDAGGKHEKWTVEFEDGETRVLLARFLEVDSSG
jgi:hypothetical protein